MTGEIAIHGVFVPAFLGVAVGAFFVMLVLRAIFRRLYFYRFVWHAGLFDAALYVVILWVAALVTMRLDSSG